MKENYKTTGDFKEDMIKEYTFLDIAEIMGWINREEVIGGKIKCPFHKNGQERTPSCQIGDHFFRCYGECGKKGDIFTFGMLKEEKSFPEVVFDIAKALGCEIEDKIRISEKQKMLTKLKATWNTYREDFKKNLKTNENLRSRYEKLFPIECGYDKVTNRIVVPFTGINGDIYGFTKRILSESKAHAKWVHDNIENSLTDNCANMCGISNLYRHEDAYLVEGPGDIAGMLRAEFPNTASLCGTNNFNERVVNYLSSIGINSITLVMDGDDAGKKASLKNSEYLITNYYFFASNSFVAQLTDDRDPGDYGTDELRETVNAKVPMIQYFLENLTNTALIYCFKTSKGKMIRNDIINYIREKYDVEEDECMKVLLENRDDYLEDEKTKLQASVSIDDFVASDTYKNMSSDKAKAILKRKFGVN